MNRRRILSITLVCGALAGVSGAGQFGEKQAVITPEKKRSPVQRDKLDAPEIARGQRGTSQPAIFPNEFRSLDGTFNNGTNPTWGAIGTPLMRVVGSDYGDGVGSPAGVDRRSARTVSTIIFDQHDTVVENPYGYTDFMWQWGQFLDHDIDETPVTSPSDDFDIPVIARDPWFDPTGTGTVTIPFGRSAFVMVGGVREQVNNITAFIDASNVYGADGARADALRTLDGTGQLKTSAGDMLPFNTGGLHNAPTDKDPSFFVAGDIRANEQVGLTAMHTLFVREHNRLATIIKAQNPSLTGDEVYEHARAFVAGEMQAITFNEFLPKLLGPGAIPAYAGYDETANPSISNLFATAAYRVGHTMLSTQIMRVDSNGNEIGAGHLSLADAFFTPAETSAQGIDPVLRGLASQRAQNVDALVISDIRNFLFGPPGSGGLDLAALNIQRGRDHGLPSYNDIREAFGFARLTAFNEVNPADKRLAQKLRKAYKTVDQIDAWVGLLAEPHANGAFVGETLRAVLADQFTRLRDGDRFWYESYLPQPMVDEVNAMTLAEIIRANTAVGEEIQDDVFTLTELSPADVAEPFGTVTKKDFQIFMRAYRRGDALADIDGNGSVNATDASLFVQAYRTDLTKDNGVKRNMKR